MPSLCGVIKGGVVSSGNVLFRETVTSSYCMPRGGSLHNSFCLVEQTLNLVRDVSLDFVVLLSPLVVFLRPLSFVDSNRDKACTFFFNDLPSNSLSQAACRPQETRSEQAITCRRDDGGTQGSTPRNAPVMCCQTSTVNPCGCCQSL